jgi:hypothetical protein
MQQAPVDFMQQAQFPEFLQRHVFLRIVSHGVPPSSVGRCRRRLRSIAI